MTVSPFKLLCGVGLLAIFSSTISKSPALPLFVSHLGGGPAAIGLIASISACTGILFSFPAGILSDRIGRKHMLLFSALVFATAPFLYLTVREVWQLALVRFYHGLATAIFVPVAMAMVSDLFQKGRGEKMGWFSTATLLGRFLAPAMGGAILGFYTTQQTTGFHILYFICGAAGLAVFCSVFFLPDLNTERQKSPVPHPHWRESIKEILRNRAIMLTCGVEAAILFAYGTFETFLPAHALSAGLNPYQVGLCLSSQILTIALAKPVLGRFSDRHGRPGQILFGAVAAGICIAFFALAGSFVPLLALSILLGLTISVVTSASAAHIADLSKNGAQGSAMGILGSIMDMGHSLGPLIGGLLAASLGLPASFLGACIILAAASLLFVLSQNTPAA
ncbi:MAG: MFS transporter [Proteobacteria bacterium]|nr:MFS transporter [Pseudomonadota bacterium]MBU1546227.1 MFS transporter [Pseudomonadota bacterium]MBU2619313.1 MFS transporter [Pseudomonadota bacterium]